MTVALEELRRRIEALQHKLQGLAEDLRDLASLVDQAVDESAAQTLDAGAAGVQVHHVHLMDFPTATRRPCGVPGCPWTP